LKRRVCCRTANKTSHGVTFQLHLKKHLPGWAAQLPQGRCGAGVVILQRFTSERHGKPSNRRRTRSLAR
jgi:hypothetical protein